MKKKNKLQSITIIIALIIVLCSTHISAAEQESSFDELIAAQAQANEANEVLMQYFFAEYGLEYPDYFGGCYIEENILHIRLVSPTDEEYSALINLLSDYEDKILFENGSFSQTELQHYADEMADSLQEQGIEVTHWAIQSKTGDVIIGVIPDDINFATQVTKKAQLYLINKSFPKIVIEEGTYIQTSTTTVYGGGEIKINGEAGSIGACGSYSGTPALITCGHWDAPIGSTVKMQNKTIGTLVYKQYANEEIGDYAIIALNYSEDIDPMHIIGNSTRGFITIDGGTYLSPAEGAYVVKYGDVSGYSYGTVTRTNVTVRANNTTRIKGITEVELSSGSSAGGDSGGPYLINGAFCGVHHGSNQEGTSILVYFTPYSVILTGGFTATGNHTCNRWFNANSTNHSGYCNICKATVYEAHGKYWDDSEGRCTRCGRTDSITEIH